MQNLEILIREQPKTTRHALASVQSSFLTLLLISLMKADNYVFSFCLLKCIPVIAQSEVGFEIHQTSFYVETSLKDNRSLESSLKSPIKMQTPNKHILRRKGEKSRSTASHFSRNTACTLQFLLWISVRFLQLGSKLGPVTWEMCFFSVASSYYYSWSFQWVLCIDSEFPGECLSAITITSTFYPFSCTLYLTFSSGEHDEDSSYRKCVVVKLTRAEIWAKSRNDSEGFCFILIQILKLWKLHVHIILYKS